MKALSTLKMLLIVATSLSCIGLQAADAAKGHALNRFGHVGKTLPASGPVPKVILISLDGATPRLIDKYIGPGVTGVSLLRGIGSHAVQNVTATPSLTAVAHIAIATGSTAVHNDIPSNTFQGVAGTLSSSISGFAAPIGGYQISPLGPTPNPTAKPLWLSLADAGKKAVTATWPGGDGADIRINGTIVQSAVPTRTVDYTVPFGAFGGLGAQGFDLTGASFTPDATIEAELASAGHPSYSPVKVATVETLFCAPDTRTAAAARFNM